MEEDLTELNYVNLEKLNMSLLMTSNDVYARPDPDFQQFWADVWVGIVLTLMVLTCVCCMCSCLLYHKFQQWKRSVLETRNAANLESGNGIDTDLPSYTIASGLPNYQEALEQLKKVKEMIKKPDNNECVPKPTPSTPLAVVNLFQMYKTNDPVTSTKPS